MKRFTAFAVVLCGLAGCRPEPAPLPPAPAAPAPTTQVQPAPPTPLPGDSARYDCGELSVGAQFHGDAVTLTWVDHELRLPGAVAASGARYADELGNEFWTKDAEAMLTLVGESSPRQCVSAAGDAGTGEEGPATGFHASGKDPDWVADVGLLDAPTLRIRTDGKTLDVQDLVVADDRWSGTVTAGREVSLQFERAPCADAVSGEAFEAKVTLRLGAEERSGCGRFVH